MLCVIECVIDKTGELYRDYLAMLALTLQGVLKYY